jgi:integrase
MASIHRREGSPYWRAAWRDAQGRLQARSTKQRDRNQAMSVALEYERAEKLAGSGTLTEAQARRVLADILERTGGESLRTPSIRDHLHAWLNGKVNATPGTVEKYRKTVTSFLDHIGAAARKPLLALTAGMVERFLKARQKEGCSPTTVTIDGKILRAALAKAWKQGLISVNPAAAVELPGVRPVERGTFTQAEIAMLVATAEGEWRTLVLLGFYTGARLGDCCRMRWQDADLATGTLSYQQRKTGAKVTVPIHPELAAHLEGLAAQDTVVEFLAPHMAGLKPGGRHGLSEGFKRIMRQAGLDLQTVQGGGKRMQSRRTFHALRHSFTSALANAGVSPELRMKLTGHKSERVHAGYSHLDLDTLRAAVGKLSALTV